MTNDGQTAVCPRCDIDSVIGPASGIALTDAVFSLRDGELLVQLSAFRCPSPNSAVAPEPTAAVPSSERERQAVSPAIDVRAV